MPGDDLFAFLDESGNFDFSKKGSRFFILNAIVTSDPIQGAADLLKWRHHILECGPETLQVARPRVCTFFHCAEDAQYTRDGVFRVVQNLDFRAYGVVVEKRKVHPKIQTQERLYDRAFRGLIRGIAARISLTRLTVFASKFHLKSKEQAFIGALKSYLAEISELKYGLHFHPNQSHHMLQVSDHVCWALSRKYERSDLRSYNLVSNKVEMEFDLFRKGTTFFY